MIVKHPLLVSSQTITQFLCYVLHYKIGPGSMNFAANGEGMYDRYYTQKGSTS